MYSDWVLCWLLEDPCAYTNDEAPTKCIHWKDPDCTPLSFPHLSPVLEPLFKGLVIVLFKVPHLFPEEATTALSDVQVCSAPGKGAVGAWLWAIKGESKGRAKPLPWKSFVIPTRSVLSGLKTSQINLKHESWSILCSLSACTTSSLCLFAYR